MKSICLAFIPLLLLFGCKSNTKPAAETGMAKDSAQSGRLIKTLGPVYNGIWIKTDYFEKIAQTKSLLAAVDKITGITGIYVNTKAIDGDSLIVNVGWENHNDGNVTLKFRPGKQLASLKFGDDDLGYSIKNGDTTLTLFQTYNGVLFKTGYRRIRNDNAGENLTYWINYTINKTLIAGDYTLTGPKGQLNKITFTETGQVIGFGAFKKYLVEADLNRGPMNNLDMVTFDMYSSKQQAYHYVFTGNQLKLYETRPNANSTLLVRDKLKYTLTRQDAQGD